MDGVGVEGGNQKVTRAKGGVAHHKDRALRSYGKARGAGIGVVVFATRDVVGVFR